MYDLLVEQVADGVTAYYDITGISQDYATLRVVITAGPNYLGASVTDELGFIPIMSDGLFVTGTGARDAYKANPRFFSADAATATFGEGVYLQGADTSNLNAANCFGVFDLHMYSIDAGNLGATATSVDGRKITFFSTDEQNTPISGSLDYVPRDAVNTSNCDATVTGIRFCNPASLATPVRAGAKISIYGVTPL